MNHYNHYLGDPGYLPKDLERYRKLDGETVRNVAEAQLANASRVVVYGVPGKQDLGPEVPTPPAPQAATAGATESVNDAQD